MLSQAIKKPFEIHSLLDGGSVNIASFCFTVILILILILHREHWL